MQGYKQNYIKESNERVNSFNERPQLQSTCTIVNNLTQGLTHQIEDIKVEVTGQNIPDPILNFDELYLHRLLLNNLLYNSYTKPTTVQKYGIPIVLNGRDLMSCAQTGSGKTLAFLLPILSVIYQNLDHYRENIYESTRINPLAVILTPTRELALQIYDEARKLSYKTFIKTHVVYGGVDIRIQMQNLNRGCDILIATPGRLIDLCDRGKVSFSHVRFLVLDEGDRMLEMGFEPQIRNIVENRDMTNIYNRQTMMFSATFPKEIQHLAKVFLRHDYIFLSVGRVGSTTSMIKQHIELVEENEKHLFLLDLLNMNPNALTLIFVETKAKANELEYFLIKENYAAVSIHGDKSQYEREKALNLFRSNIKNILVATAVAARGLDIHNIQYVINFDLPTDIEEYVHRIGRTGRAGQTGTAISFYNNKNANITADLVKILNETQQVVPNFLNKKEIEQASYEKRNLYQNRYQTNRDFRQDYQPKRSVNYESKSSFESSYRYDNKRSFQSSGAKTYDKAGIENKNSKNLDWFDKE
jgi:superfamily II DNA/RNA helicase